MNTKDLFQLIFENSATGKSLTQPGGEIHVNRAFADMLGYTSDELQQVNWKKISHPDDIEPTTQLVEKLLRGPETMGQMDKRYIHKNGQVVETHLKTYLQRDTKGKPLFFITDIFDITDQRKVEREVEENRRFLQTITSEVQEVIFALDPAGKFLFSDGKGLQKLGLKPGEVVGQYAPDVYRDYPEVVDAINRSLSGNLVKVTRLQVDQVVFETTFQPIFDKKHRLTMVAGLAVDVTESVHKEDDLRKSEQWYKSLFRKNESVMLMIDPATGNIKDANPAACSFYGWSHEELCRKKIMEINTMPVEDVVSRMNEAREDRHSHFFFQHRLSTGAIRFVEVYSTPVQFENDTLLFSIIHDITERKKIEDKLIEARETLEKRVQERTMALEILNRELAFKNKELEEFTYITSHDLQEPLLSLTTCSEMLKEEYGGNLDNDGHRCLSYIHDSAIRMRKQVKALQQYTLLGHESITPEIDLQEVVDKAISRIKLTPELPETQFFTGKLPVISGYASDLEILFYELFSNAIIYRREGVKPVITISCSEKSNEWEFSVRDNGIGISGKYCDKVFTLFRRLHNRHEYVGIGIGLAFCKKIVSQHGGQIWVESELGQGALFKFTIPSKKEFDSALSYQEINY